MTAEHTPAPWAYEASSGAIYYADGDVEPLIASTNLECVTMDQGDADGRLIAAAPELANALRQMVERFGHVKCLQVGAALTALQKAGLET